MQKKFNSKCVLANLSKLKKYTNYLQNDSLREGDFEL